MHDPPCKVRAARRMEVRVALAARKFHSYRIKLGSAFTLISIYARAIALVNEHSGNTLGGTVRVEVR